MRTLAIGDIHGCFRALVTLESFAAFKPDDCIISLGDYVDRGPNSRSVVEWLMNRHANSNLIALRGNHELMMLAARQSEGDRDDWLACGGDAALMSYRTDRIDEIPDSHWHFLGTCLRSHYVTKTHFFVHANAHADLSPDDQPDYMLYWESFGDPLPHESGLTIICGHTAQRNGYPLNVGHAVCIDTGACCRGWLTGLDVHTRYCWQANESGETRSFWLDDGP